MEKSVEEKLILKQKYNENTHIFEQRERCRRLQIILFRLVTSKATIRGKERIIAFFFIYFCFLAFVMINFFSN